MQTTVLALEGREAVACDERQNVLQRHGLRYPPDCQLRRPCVDHGGRSCGDLHSFLPQRGSLITGFKVAGQVPDQPPRGVEPRPGFSPEDPHS